MSSILPNQAISIRQPWAWLIAHGWKNIENRSWRTRFRGPVLIHASKSISKREYAACRLFVAGFADLELPPMETFERGGIIGVATVLDCVAAHPSEWFCGPWGFVLAEQRPLPFRPCKGALGFFRPAYPRTPAEPTGRAYASVDELVAAECSPAVRAGYARLRAPASPEQARGCVTCIGCLGWPSVQHGRRDWYVSCDTCSDHARNKYRMSTGPTRAAAVQAWNEMNERA